MDDIICFGSTFEETLQRLEEVLKRLMSSNLKLKATKCTLFQRSVSFLGYRATSDGIMPAIDKVKYIQSIPVPKNLTELRHFLGYLGYYRRFIRNFSERAAPLNRLMEAGQSFIWTEDCQRAFVDLRSALFGDEVMAYPRFDEKGGIFIVDCDSSNYAVGGCLSQMQWCEQSQSEVERPIMFASKTLDKSQRQYCTTRKELLAVVTFVQQFRHLLLGRIFVIRSDHSSLRWLMRFKSPTDQLARWLEVLSQYDFVLCHRKGSKHDNADFWSRVGCDPYECDCYDRSTILEELPCGGCKTCRKRQEQWSIMEDVDDVVPLFARYVGGRGMSRGKVYHSCVNAFLTLITMLCCVVEISTYRIRGIIAGSKKLFNSGVAKASSVIKSVWSKRLRRLKPRTCNESLTEPPVFQFSLESDSKSDGIISQSDKVSSQNGSILLELKRSFLASYQPEQVQKMQKGRS